jgi:hypothetical protein
MRVRGLEALETGTGPAVRGARRRPCRQDLGSTQDVRQNDGSSRLGLAVLRLRCAPDVAVMQATNLGNREDRAERWRLDWSPIGSVLLEREASASPMIGCEVCREDSSKVTLAENDDMVQALAPD